MASNGGRGGPPASPLLKRAVELTEDGQWHDYDDVVRELCKLVPPGKAMRRAEKSRRYTGPPERTKYDETERVLETGKKSYARDHLQKVWFEVKPVGRREPGGLPRQIRLINMPPRILRDRELAARGRLVQPQTSIPLLLAGADVREHLAGLSAEQLLRLIQAMTTEMIEMKGVLVEMKIVMARLQTSESNWLEW